MTQFNPAAWAHDILAMPWRPIPEDPRGRRCHRERIPYTAAEITERDTLLEQWEHLTDTLKGKGWLVYGDDDELEPYRHHQRVECVWDETVEEWKARLDELGPETIIIPTIQRDAIHLPVTE